MNLRFLALVMVGFPGLFGQSYTFQQMTLPPPAGTIVASATTSDGTLQVVTRPQQYSIPAFSAGSLFTQTTPGGELNYVGPINWNGFNYETVIYDSASQGMQGVTMWGFSKQPGNVSYICDGTPVTTSNMQQLGLYSRQCVLTRLTRNPLSSGPVCSGYVFDGVAGDLPYYWRALTYDVDRSLYLTGVPQDRSSSTVYKMAAKDIPPTTGTCKFSTVARNNREVLQPFPSTGGRFLAELVTSAAPGDWVVSDIALLNGSSVTVLVSTQAADNPQVLATGYPNLRCDVATQTCVIGWNAGGQGHYGLFNSSTGKIDEVFGDPNVTSRLLRRRPRPIL